MPRQKRILTLDGGGVRGLSSLLILRKLLCMVNQELTGSVGLPVSPKDIFDLVAGTSTGGLITLMLVKLDMSVDKCIQEYKALSRSIFRRRNLLGRFTSDLGQSRYSGDHLAPKIENVIERRGFGVDLKMIDGKNLVKTACSVIARELQGDWSRVRNPNPVFLCSHDHGLKDDALNTDISKQITVKQSAQATTAAPTFFPPVRVFDKILVDGAYGETNNPSEAVYDHFRGWEKLVSGGKHPLIMLNIGTGAATRKQEQLRAPNPPWYLRYLPAPLLNLWRSSRDLVFLAAECENVAGRMDHKADELEHKALQYVRFCEDVKLHEIHLDDYKAVESGAIERHTNAYLERADVVEKLHAAAKMLALGSRAHRRAQKSGTLKEGVERMSEWSTPESGSPMTSSEESKSSAGSGCSDKEEREERKLVLGDGQEVVGNVAQGKNGLSVRLPPALTMWDLRGLVEEPVAVEARQGDGGRESGDGLGDGRGASIADAGIADAELEARRGQRRQSSNPSEIFWNAANGLKGLGDGKGVKAVMEGLLFREA